jgi:hypothetical protein
MTAETTFAQASSSTRSALFGSPRTAAPVGARPSCDAGRCGGPGYARTWHRPHQPSQFVDASQPPPHTRRNNRKFTKRLNTSPRSDTTPPSKELSGMGGEIKNPLQIKGKASFLPCLLASSPFVPREEDRPRWGLP